MNFVWNSTLSPRFAKLPRVLQPFGLLARNIVSFFYRMRDYRDIHFAEVEHSLQLGVRYVIDCDVRGDIAEFGTMSGRTAQVLARAMKTYDRFRKGEFKTLHLFDSFQGLPQAESEIDRQSPHVLSGVWGPGTCLGVTESDLMRVCSRYVGKQRVQIYPGWFTETLPKIPQGTTFAMIHIDCDMYQSTKDVLDYCFSRGLIHEGTAVFFDDWNCNAARPDLGERRAWTEAVEKYNVVFSDCREYGMGCKKLIVHSLSTQ